MNDFEINNENQKSCSTFIYELIPPDMEQMSPGELESWIREIQLCLNQLPEILNEKNSNQHSKKKVGFSTLFKWNKREEDDLWYKNYWLKNKILIETNNPSFNLPKIRLMEVDNRSFLFSEEGEQTFYSDAVMGDDYFKVNGEYFRLINFYEMPKSLHPSELMDIGDYCLFFKKVERGEARRRVDMQRKLHHANLYNVLRNIESEASFKEAEGLSEKLTLGEESLFEVEGWFLLRSWSLDELGLKTEALIKNLDKIELTPHIEAESLTALFPSLIRGVKPLFKRTHDCPSSFLTNLLPLRKDELMEIGIKFYSTRFNPINFDLFSGNALNFNTLISGVSGTGKSMLAQKLLTEELLLGTKGIVLDLGNSFRKTCLYHEGSIFDHKFNPLQFRSPEYLKEFITSIIPKSELTLRLEGKIFSFLELNGKNAKNFRSLVESLKEEIPGIDFYFSELWQYFTDEETTLSTLTYVDTTIFPEKMKAPLIIYLIECFKHLKGKRIFVFDECWSFLENNASYVAECFRTFRKHGASALAISQGLEDFTSTQLGKVIVQNSFHKFFFNQTVSSLSGEGHLNEFDREKIHSLQTKRGEFSEFYYKAEGMKKILRFSPSHLEYELFTSSFDEKIAFDRFNEVYKNYFTFPLLIERWVDFKYHHGGMKHD